jgi:hypothetical protein
VSTKSRDVDPILKNRGFEAGTRYILHEVVERMGVMEKGIAAMAQMLDQMVTIQTNTVAVATQMKNTIETITRAKDEAEDDRPNPYDGGRQ